MGVGSIEWGSGSSWRGTGAVPDHSQAPVQLMCYELLPYALVRAGHMSEETFLEGVKKEPSREGDGRVDVWTSFLGDVTSQGSVSVDELETLRVVPGDIIVLYGMFDEGVHVMIASGGSSTEGLQVYSLAANNPTNYLTEATLTAIIKPYRGLEVSCVRVFSLKQELLI